MQNTQYALQILHNYHSLNAPFVKQILPLVSFTGLLLTIAPSFLVFAGAIDIAQHKTFMLIGTFIWFATAPFWVGKRGKQLQEPS